MTRRLPVSAALLFASLALVPAALAQGQPAAGPDAAVLDKAIAQIRKDAAADINTIITAAMRFSADENTKFWPMYKAFEEKRRPLADERLAIIKEYAKNFSTMTDVKAMELTQKAQALDDKLTSTKREFLAELGKVFPGKTVARYAQVQRRIDLLVDLTIASEIPLVQ